MRDRIMSLLQPRRCRNLRMALRTDVVVLHASPRDMFMIDRRYRDYSEGQLFELKKEIEHDIELVEHEKAALFEYYSTRGPYHSWIHKDEEYVGLADQINDFSRQIDEIRAELDARNEERLRAREAREFRPNRQRQGSRRKDQEEASASQSEREPGDSRVEIACQCVPPRRKMISAKAFDKGGLICTTCRKRFQKTINGFVLRSSS